jgi:hypothetical protein
MNFGAGEVRVLNPSKDIAKEIVLDVLIRHRDAIKQARTGERPYLEKENEKISDNEKRLNQVRALSLIIGSQREMITIARPIIYNNSQKQWKKRYPEEKKRALHPFDTYKCDYNDLLLWLDFLKECMNEIELASRTRTTDDDFLFEIINILGEKELVLTKNFHDMLEDLESSYEQIYLKMIRHKIVSQGLEEDDDMTYKEKEQEAIRRILEA